MRIEYPLTAFYEALAAWDKHQQAYVKSLEAARQPAPTPEQLIGYRSVWIEGFLEAKVTNANDQRAES